MPLVAELFAQFADIQLLAGRDIKRQHLMDADVLLVRSGSKFWDNPTIGLMYRLIGNTI